MEDTTYRTKKSAHKELGDIDNRFSVAEIPQDIFTLRREFGEYVIKNSEDLDVRDRVAIKYGMPGEEGPKGHSVVDTISNRKFALIRYPKVVGGTEQELGVGFTLGEFKNNKIVGTPEDAAQAMGLPADFKIDDLPSLAAVERKDFSVEDVLRDAINQEQALQNGPDVNGGPAVDTRNMLASHSKREAAIDNYLEDQKVLIDNTKQDMTDFDALLNNDTATKEERIAHFAKRTAMANEIKNQELNVLKAIVTPEKFTLDSEGKAVLVDADDLNNRFAKTREQTTIPLGDPNGKYNIGKVSAAHIEDSPSILEGDTILSSIRVRTSGDDHADVNIYAVKNEGQAWLRAEKVSMDGFEALDAEAFAGIGIDSNKFVVGGDTLPAQVIEQITPAALQENIARRQILNHNTWKGEPGFAGEPVKEHKASDWTYPRSTDEGDYQHSVLEVRALNEIQARKADNRTTVTDLSAKQIKNLEEFGIIRHAQIKKDKGYEYIGGASGHLITDHLNNSVQLVGQTMVNTDRNSGVGEPKVETVEFDIAIRPDRPDRIGIQYPVSGSSQGSIGIDVYASAYQEQHGHDWELAGDAMRADFKGQSVVDTDETRYTGKNIVEALSVSTDIIHSDDPKMHNNFGRGIKDESVVNLERATELRTGHDMKMEAMDRIEPTRLSRTRP